MPRLTLNYGMEKVEVEAPRLVSSQRGAPSRPTTDVGAAARAVLETPLEFPPLRRSLTPDDHMVVTVREETTHVDELLTPVLEVLQEAGVQLQNVTLLFPPRLPATTMPTPVEQVLTRFPGVRTEVHDPAKPDQLAYLASTKAGRRVYLNRSLVDADQLVVVGRFEYDSILGYGGGLSDLFPTFSDDATRAEYALKLSDAVPGVRARPVWQEIGEIGWLLGMPFLLQVVEGHGDDILHVRGGLAELVTNEGHRLLDQEWRVTLAEAPELVIATITGDPARQRFGDVTMALAAAARVVQPGGRIVVLSRVGGDLGPSAPHLRAAENPAKGLATVRQHKLPDAISAWQLAAAAQRAKLYLLSNIPEEVAEELFVTPLDDANQVQRLINDALSVAVLTDAHRTMAVLK